MVMLVVASLHDGDFGVYVCCDENSLFGGSGGAFHTGGYGNGGGRCGNS